MDIIKHKYLFLGISAVLVLLGILSVAVFGFKQGIDFSGGTLWQIKFNNKENVSLANLSAFFAENYKDKTVVRAGETEMDFSIRMPEISEAEHQRLLSGLKEEFGGVEELSFASIGPAIGRELRSRALLAFGLVLLGISFYIAFAFRKVSYPVSSWKYGLATLICLFHDAIIPAGLFAFWGWQKGIEIDTNFIVAILVIMGFSVHDTIVVFDRIRENLSLSKNKENFGAIVNASINQTFARSVNTSLTLVLVLFTLYFLGAPSLGYFNLIILIGTVVGTYSSIFAASPLLVIFRGGVKKLTPHLWKTE